MGVIEVVRGGIVESSHPVHVAVSDASGRLVASVGNATRNTFYRSAAKPIQALPLVEEGVLDRFGFTDEELALACASHEGEPVHVAGARSMLAKAGLEEGALRCGPHPPFAPGEARALVENGEAPKPIHNNCSGKHAGMLALAVTMGWNPDDYHLHEHPVQRRMLGEVARWSRVPERDIGIGIDGCGVSCFSVPLIDMAASFARFSVAASEGGAPGRVVSAMTSHPHMVGGTGRTCTGVMERTGPRAFVKLGAEGVYTGGAPGLGVGFAIKVEDGARRAVEAALVRVLMLLDLVDAADLRALEEWREPRLRNTRGDTVGTVRASFDLVPA
ncbi:MAG: asparaginase [Gemmatimonadetes bacterium]|nr:asparaginase [Gemmatimonadota bacterium]